jgi:hypothetical protein
MTRLSHLLLVSTAPLALIVAGCGGSGYSSNPSNSSFSIAPATASIDTNGQVQFTATLANGSPATSVHWTVLSGQNSSQIGQGSVDPANGLYYPPSALSQDSVQVKVQANLTSNAYQTATAVITVTPGFIQFVTPETATLAAGATLPVTATIAEVGGGTVNWSISSSLSSSSSPGSAGGSLSSTSCQRGGLSSSNPIYTSCSATYTAPASPPAQPIYIVASVAANSATTSYAKLLLNSSGLNTSGLNNQGAQTGAVQMGTSGGNNNDVDTDSNGNILDCASGTLGALVQDQSSNLYILSNNHVLAEADQGVVGDTIIQPGLVDTGCTQLASGVTGIRALATLQYWAPLINASVNVDAALASTTSASVDTSGAILSLGASGGGSNQIDAAAPVAGTGETLTAANINNIHVAKSGRTTGLTCSTVDVINASVKISYYKDAADTLFYTAKTFTNQIGIPGNYFSDNGDSGSLVVDTANAQPVGLFYAGSAGTSNAPGESFANPISDVLTNLAQYSSAPSGTSFSIVGGAPHTVNCLNYDANIANASIVVSADRISAARTVASSKGNALIDTSKGILGVSAGKSLDHPGEAAVLVYVDRDRSSSVTVPQTISGLRTRTIPTTAADVANGTAPTDVSVAPGIHLPQPALDGARAVAHQYTSQLMSDPAFFGVGVAQSQDSPNEAALMVFVDRTRTPQSQPATVGGLRVRYRTLNPIRVNHTAQATR